MKAQSTYALICLFAMIGAAISTKTSGESKEQSDRRKGCGGLVVEPPKPTTTAAPSTTPSTVPTPAPGQCYCTPSPGTAGPGSGSGEEHFHSHCILIEVFINFTLQLTTTQQIYWEEWLIDIQDNILANLNLTEDQKIVLISYSLKAFFSIHVDIYNILSYQKISTWGFVADFLYVSVNIQLEITQRIVTIRGNGGCDLTDALKNASASWNANDQASVNSLIIDIHAILIDVTYTYEQQLAVIFQLLESFIANNPSLDILSIEITGYGSLEFFLDVCHVYERTTTLSVVIGGSSVSDCALLAALQQASLNGSFTASEQMQIDQLRQTLTLYFQANIDLSLRLEYVSYTIYQQFKLAPFLISIIEQISCGEWGSIIDLLFCSGICSNYGCGNPNQGPGPQGGSTAGPTSTPVKPADCSKCASLIVVDSNNQTIITNVLVQAYATFTSSQKLGFNSCFNKVRKAIWDNVSFPTPSSKLTELHTDFLQYNNNSVTNQQLVFNLTISSWYGTIGDFVACL